MHTLSIGVPSGTTDRSCARLSAEWLLGSEPSTASKQSSSPKCAMIRFKNSVGLPEATATCAPFSFSALKSGVIPGYMSASNSPIVPYRSRYSPTARSASSSFNPHNSTNDQNNDGPTNFLRTSSPGTAFPIRRSASAALAMIPRPLSATVPSKSNATTSNLKTITQIYYITTI